MSLVYFLRFLVEILKIYTEFSIANIVDVARKFAPEYDGEAVYNEYAKKVK